LAEGSSCFPKVTPVSRKAGIFLQNRGGKPLTCYYSFVPRGNFSWERALCENKHSALSSGKHKCSSTHPRPARNHPRDQQFPDNPSKAAAPRPGQTRVSKASATSASWRRPFLPAANPPSSSSPRSGQRSGREVLRNTKGGYLV